MEDGDYCLFIRGTRACGESSLLGLAVDINSTHQFVPTLKTVHTLLCFCFVNNAFFRMAILITVKHSLSIQSRISVPFIFCHSRHSRQLGATTSMKRHDTKERHLPWLLPSVAARKFSHFFRCKSIPGDKRRELGKIHKGSKRRILEKTTSSISFPGKRRNDAALQLAHSCLFRSTS